MDKKLARIKSKFLCQSAFVLYSNQATDFRLEPGYDGAV